MSDANADPARPFAATAAAAIAGQTAIEALGVPIERPAAPSLAGPPPQDLSLFGYFFRATADDYATFAGRARRKEFCGFAVFYLLFWLVCAATVALGVASSRFAGSDANLSPLLFIGGGLIVLYGLGMVVPGLAVATRRLHDIGRSGWWQLLHMVPVVGSLALFALLLLPGQPEPNRFGPSPRPPRSGR
jgi:uncharacterized membrane protein YhaH (DUF805 family)